MPAIPVVPRARRKDGASSLPVDELLRPLIVSNRRGLVCLTAPPGGGKTTALAYLRSKLPAEVRLFDADQRPAARSAANDAMVILATASAAQDTTTIAVFELCPWTMDDCIAYLAARHRERAKLVLERLSGMEAVLSFPGAVQLAVAVLDRMAADSSIASVPEALSGIVAEHPMPETDRESLVLVFFRNLGVDISDVPERTLPWWLRHGAMQRMFIAHWITDRLSEGAVPACLNRTLARPVLDELAFLLRSRLPAVATLERLLASNPQGPAIPMTASLLLRLDPAWRPIYGPPLNLAQADLRSAQWSGMDLHGSALGQADCRGADFRDADLSDVKGAGAIMTDANLRGARLVRGAFTDAQFGGADLSHCDLSEASFRRSDLTGASLQSATAVRACFDHAILNCVAHRASFRLASLVDTEIGASDFKDCDFSYARLSGVSMRRAVWHGASFHEATLFRCNLEGLTIDGADFTKANLAGSLLTGSVMPGACFRDACLTDTGLAEIDWEGADLSDADLRNASFHLGSSRSGLVGSTIPCEGSRTGFYTDDFYEQDYKSPEEIRKAALVGADLRGANLSHTDFYLVDLRGAKYTEDQERHFVLCGAILATRVS